jgi:ApaG protein
MRYEIETMGVSVSVEPSFSLAQSDPSEDTYVFSYDVTIRNRLPQSIQLLFRHWHVHDSAGEDSVLDGEGVIGQQPVLLPGGVHRYSSFCVLQSPVGYMEGYYTFEGADEGEFRVAIPRFPLEAPLPPPHGEDASELTN